MRHSILASILPLLIPAALMAQERPDFSDEVREFIAVDAPAVLLTNVTVVDGTGRQQMPNQAVLIENGRIAQVGTTGDVRAPEGAEILDLDGHTVIPGIVGLHNHTFYTTMHRIAQLSTSAPRLYLASGVTTIRTTGSYQPYAEINLKRAIEIGEEAGPRMHLTGPHITGPDQSFDQFAQSMTGVGTAEEASRVVAYWAEEGATWLKLFTGIDRAAARAAIEEAHSRGLKVTGHLCSLSYTEAVQLGIDNIEHGFFFNTDWDPEKEPDHCPPGALTRLADVDLDSPEVAGTIRTMVEAGVPMTSTLAVAETTLPNRPPLEDRVIDVLAPEFAADYLDVREEIAALAAAESPWIPIWEKALRFERMFHEAGGVLVAGSDPAYLGGTVPGFGDQRNYELLLEAGFDPLEAIRIMTLNGAIVLGEDDLYGSIEEGKLADIVVIEGDPILYPEEIRNVRVVFREGVGYDSEALIASVRGQVGIR